MLFAAKHEDVERNSLNVVLSAVLQAQSFSDNSCPCEELVFTIGNRGNITDDPLIVMD